MHEWTCTTACIECTTPANIGNVRFMAFVQANSEIGSIINYNCPDDIQTVYPRPYTILSLEIMELNQFLSGSLIILIISNCIKSGEKKSGGNDRDRMSWKWSTQCNSFIFRHPCDGFMWMCMCAQYNVLHCVPFRKQDKSIHWTIRLPIRMIGIKVSPYPFMKTW